MVNNKYNKQEKLGFARKYHTSDMTMKETAKWWNEKYGYDLHPNSGTFSRWLNKYKSEIKNGGDESMSKNKETKSKDGLGKLKTQVDQSQVDQTEQVSNEKEYNPNEGGNDGPKTKQSSGNGSKSGGLALDISKVSDYIKDHKKQIGLLLAGVAIVGVFLYVKPTINVDDLRRHGSSNSGNSAGDNDGDGGGGNDGGNLDEGWTGE